VEKLINIIFK